MGDDLGMEEDIWMGPLEAAMCHDWTCQNVHALEEGQSVRALAPQPQLHPQGLGLTPPFNLSWSLTPPLTPLIPLIIMFACF